jgi:hypothetical protein
MRSCIHCGRTDHQRRTHKRCLFRLTGISAVNDRRRISDGVDRLSMLPDELKQHIIDRLDLVSLCRMSLIDKRWNLFIDNPQWWKEMCLLSNITMILPEESNLEKNIYISETLSRCHKCLRVKTSRRSVFRHERLTCWDCEQAITKITVTRAKSEYQLNDQDLAGLRSVEAQNPRYRYFAPMVLYSLDDIVRTAHDKWGGQEGLNEARAKSKKRSESIRLAKAKKAQSRSNELTKALEDNGLELRDDSVLCAKYIRGDQEYTLDEVVSIMREMHYLHEHTDYNRSLARQIEESSGALLWSYYDQQHPCEICTCGLPLIDPADINW